MLFYGAIGNPIEGDKMVSFSASPTVRNLPLTMACRKTGLKPEELTRRAVEAKVGDICFLPYGETRLFFSLNDVFKLCSPFWPKKKRKDFTVRSAVRQWQTKRT